MNLKKIAITALSCLWMQTAFAQGESNQWSLEECIDYARTHNITLQINKLDVVSSKENLLNAKEQRYPNLNFSFNHNFNRGLAIDPVTNARRSQSFNSGNLGLSTGINIYAGSRIANGIKQSQVDLDAAEKNVERTQNDILLIVAGNYFNVLFANENVLASQRRVEIQSAQIERTQKLVTAGSLPRADLMDLLSQKATAELQLIQNQNNLALSKLQLKQALQIHDTTEFNIEIPAINDSFLTDTQLENRQDIYLTAVDFMPEIQAAELSIQSAFIGEKIAKGTFLPTVFLNYNYGSVYSIIQDFDNENVGSQLKDNNSHSVTLGINVPIYNRRDAKNQTALARINSQRAELQLKQTKNDLRQNIEQAYTEALAAQKTYASSVKQYESLQEQFRVVEKRFNTGAANSTDYSVAEANLNASAADVIRSKYDFIYKTKIIDFYLGNEITLD